MGRTGRDRQPPGRHAHTWSVTYFERISQQHFSSLILLSPTNRIQCECSSEYWSLQGYALFAGQSGRSYAMARSGAPKRGFDANPHSKNNSCSLQKSIFQMRWASIMKVDNFQKEVASQWCSFRTPSSYHHKSQLYESETLVTSEKIAWPKKIVCEVAKHHSNCMETIRQKLIELGQMLRGKSHGTSHPRRLPWWRLPPRRQGRDRTSKALWWPGKMMGKWWEITLQHGGYLTGLSIFIW